MNNEQIIDNMLRKRGKTFVNIGPYKENKRGFTSKLWNIILDDCFVFTRWGAAVIYNNKVSPTYLQSKLVKFSDTVSAAAKAENSIRRKLQHSNPYFRITNGYSLIPTKEQGGEEPRHSAVQIRTKNATQEVFVSYAHRNDRTVFPIVRKLEAAGINVWIDGDDMETNGPPFGVQIQKAIRNANVVIVMLTEQSNNSQWVAIETAFARHYQRPILPFRLQNVTAWGATGSQLHGIDTIRGFGKFRSTGIEQLIPQIKAFRKS
jgi:hypothetical protein|tara:strand:- start:18514 stop:19299 length:786 start_codon:yes stop_codon:yes gene_type:complete